MHNFCCVFFFSFLSMYMCVCVCVFEWQKIFSRYTARAFPSTYLCQVYKKQLQTGLTERVALLSGFQKVLGSQLCHQDTFLPPKTLSPVSCSRKKTNLFGGPMPQRDTGPLLFQAFTSRFCFARSYSDLRFITFSHLKSPRRHRKESVPRRVS